MMNHGSRFRAMFPDRVCINLDRRPERWERMQSRLAEQGLGPVARVSAADGLRLAVPSDWPETAGAYGCLQSHLTVVRDARAAGKPSLLILEDDVLFAPDFHEQFEARVDGLPTDWDMLFFGCLHHDPPTPVTPGIGRLHASFSTFMYALKETVYDAFIALNTGAQNAVDRNNWELQQQFHCYCFLPHLAWVDDSYSDAQGVATNHWYIRDSMVLRGDEIKEMEKRTAVILPYREHGDRERELRNLQFLARYYGGLFSVMIVEAAERPWLPAERLPAGCEYAHVREGRGYVAALERFAQEKDYFIVNDGGVICSRMEMRASLRKCAEHDAVGSFESYVDLDEKDSDCLLAGGACHTESYRPRARRGRFCEYFTVTEAGLAQLCQEETADEAPVGAKLRAFDSPGTALCLFAGGRRAPCDSEKFM
jgi:glycosyl transferase family 25